MIEPSKLRIGAKYHFTPDAFAPDGVVLPGSQRKRTASSKVTGVIDYINWPHRWYRVAFEYGSYTLHEGFKF